jgi:hypothetical protein
MHQVHRRLPPADGDGRSCQQRHSQWMGWIGRLAAPCHVCGLCGVPSPALTCTCRCPKCSLPSTGMAEWRPQALIFQCPGAPWGFPWRSSSPNLDGGCFHAASSPVSSSRPPSPWMSYRSSLPSRTTLPICQAIVVSDRWPDRLPLDSFILLSFSPAAVQPCTVQTAQRPLLVDSLACRYYPDQTFLQGADCII